MIVLIDWGVHPETARRRRCCWPAARRHSGSESGGLLTPPLPPGRAAATDRGLVIPGRQQPLDAAGPRPGDRAGGASVADHAVLYASGERRQRVTRRRPMIATDSDGAVSLEGS